MAIEYQPNTILIEDQGSGISLIADLRSLTLPGIPNPVPQRPLLSKVDRLEGISGMVEGGQLLLPPDAPWISEFKAEVLACPNGRYDDQVDTLTQLMNWVRQHQGFQSASNAGVEVLSEDEYGRLRWSGEAADGLDWRSRLPSSDYDHGGPWIPDC